MYKRQRSPFLNSESGILHAGLRLFGTRRNSYYCTAFRQMMQDEMPVSYTHLSRLDEYSATATYISLPPLFKDKQEYEDFHARHLKEMCIRDSRRSTP